MIKQCATALGFLVGFSVNANSNDFHSHKVEDGGTISVLGGALFKQELFNLKMLAHRSKKFTGKERVVAYPIENELCKGGTVRHIQHDVLYELSSTSLVPIETSHTSIYHQNGFREIKDYVSEQLSANSPIIYYILGTFTSCDRVSRKELDDKFRLSVGGGGGFSLGGFFDQKSSSLNRYCLSLRMNTELHPTLVAKGYIPPKSRTEMCVYADDYKAGESTNLSALGLVYDNGNYFVRGTPENRVKEILIKGAMISLIANFIGVPDVSVFPFLKNEYIEYEIDTFARKFRKESPEFQWNMLQTTLNHRYGAKISYRDYGKLSPITENYLERIEQGLSSKKPLEIYNKLISPLFYTQEAAPISTYNSIEQKSIIENNHDKGGNIDKETVSAIPWKVYISRSKCSGLTCLIRIKGSIDDEFTNSVKRAIKNSYIGSGSIQSVNCELASARKYECTIAIGGEDETKGKIKEKKFRSNLKTELKMINPKGAR